MAYSYIYGQYYYLPEITDMIKIVEILRQSKRLNGETLDISFADQLRNLLNGIEDEKVVRLVTKD